MFYLLKRVDEKQFTLGDRVMVLADFSGIPAGAKGKISEIYHEGVMVEWDWSEDELARITRHNYTPRPRSDGFGRDELEYLAVETEKHPVRYPQLNTI